jgi:glycosyltransferase involved in cell wall biosynthesis
VSAAGSSGAPAVSVVVTTYRTPPDLLAIALDSVLAQRLRDVELIVVADGPLDSEAECVIDERASDARVRIIRPGRVGRARALNAGVAAAAGPLIAIQDADDASHPARLDRQVAILQERDDLDLLGTQVRHTGEVGARPDWEDPPRAGVQPIDAELLVGNPLVHSTVLVRRAALAEVGGYATARRWQVDLDLYLRLRRAGARLGRLDDALVLKRWHTNQAFEADAHRWARLWSAYRLQVAHGRREPRPARYRYLAHATLRLGGRAGAQAVPRARALAGRRRPRSGAAEEPSRLARRPRWTGVRPPTRSLARRWFCPTR